MCDAKGQSFDVRVLSDTRVSGHDSKFVSTYVRICFDSRVRTVVAHFRARIGRLEEPGNHRRRQQNGDKRPQFAIRIRQSINVS